MPSKRPNSNYYVEDAIFSISKTAMEMHRRRRKKIDFDSFLCSENFARKRAKHIMTREPFWFIDRNYFLISGDDGTPEAIPSFTLFFRLYSSTCTQTNTQIFITRNSNWLKFWFDLHLTHPQRVAHRRERWTVFWNLRLAIYTKDRWHCTRLSFSHVRLVLSLLVKTFWSPSYHPCCCPFQVMGFFLRLIDVRPVERNKSMSRLSHKFIKSEENYFEAFFVTKGQMFAVVFVSLFMYLCMTELHDKCIHCRVTVINSNLCLIA